MKTVYLFIKGYLFMRNNIKISKAKKEKNDEFYTRYEDIEKNMPYYNSMLKDKWVLCNADNETSNFWKYFYNNYNNIGLKHLTATSIKNRYRLDYDGHIVTKSPLNEPGDFRSDECKKILKDCDVVITNPPFSLFREYFPILMENEKKFLVICNVNAGEYKCTFSYIKDNKAWFQYNSGTSYMYFEVPENYKKNGLAKVGPCGWLTNIGINDTPPLVLTKTYNSEQYPKYDNYDAIEVGIVKNIPMDYDGVMGVPVTFLDKYNPTQFEIIGKNNTAFLNGKKKFKRILIRKK